MTQAVSVQNTYDAEVVEVHSGDDLVLMVDLGVEGLYKKVRARLRHVDTPDAYKEDPSTEAGRIRDSVRTMVKDRRCRVLVHSSPKSGWKVTLFILSPDGPAEGINLNEHLIRQGYIFNKEG